MALAAEGAGAGARAAGAATLARAAGGPFGLAAGKRGSFAAAACGKGAALVAGGRAGDGAVGDGSLAAPSPGSGPAGAAVASVTGPGIGSGGHTKVTAMAPLFDVATGACMPNVISVPSATACSAAAASTAPRRGHPGSRNCARKSSRVALPRPARKVPGGGTT